MNEGGSHTEESELMMEGGGSMMDEDKDGKGLVAKREGELKSLDQQLKDMGKDPRGETFGEAFIH
jgi:hypothetical protein